MNPISPHWIGAHRGTLGTKTDKQLFAEWQPKFIKIITDDETVPYIEDVPVDTKIVVRHYPMSELFHNRGFADTRNASVETSDTTRDNIIETYYGSEGSGRDLLLVLPKATRSAMRSMQTPEDAALQHAQISERIAQWCETRGVSRQRLVFEGLNEPQLWSTEPPHLVARYEKARLVEMHKRNLCSVVGNFGVGWPGNGGVQNAPVQWDFFKTVITTMLPGDYLGLHEYWSVNGVMQNWRWWAGRYEQCPYNVPILITETGIDTGVSGQFYGSWRNLPGDEAAQAERYVDELIYYWNKCYTDGRINGIFPFTYDRGSDTWYYFDIRTEMFMQKWFAKKDTVRDLTSGSVMPPPVTPPSTSELGQAILAEAEKQQTVKINPDAALLKAIANAGMWATTSEFGYVYNGKNYTAQRGESTTDGRVIVFYVENGKWDQIMQEQR